jgi:hypothetical protein
MLFVSIGQANAPRVTDLRSTTTGRSEEMPICIIGSVFDATRAQIVGTGRTEAPSAERCV